MVGIDDVARRAGVSTATVSRALSGRGHVATATRERVEEAAAELGYVVSASASSLASGRTRNIGVLVPFLDRWFFSTVLSGIANALIATPDQVKVGLEMIKWMPCTNGGPGTYVTFAPYDHRGYKGDFLTIRELRGGELHFRGYYRPTWPSNRTSPLLGTT